MWQIFKILSLFYFYYSSFAWWSFSFPAVYTPFILSAIMLVCILTTNFKLIINERAYIILLLTIIISIFLTYVHRGNIMYFLSSFAVYIQALYLYILPQKRKIDLLQFITKFYSIILGISIIVYLSTYLINLPTIGTFKAGNMEFYPPYDNYIFFVKTRLYDNFIYRFNGPFLEPGHQAMISGLLLFANKFDLKNNKLLWIPLMGILISFSLAGYIILIISYILLFVKSTVKIISSLIVFIAINFFVTEVWNGGNNPVNVLIFERLELDEDKGIAGNNRTAKITDDYFEQNIKDGKLLLGTRGAKGDSARIVGAGYKVYLLQNGLIALLLVALLYRCLINPKCVKRYSIAFFILICCIFMQRAYPTWYSWLLTFTLGCGIHLKPIRHAILSRRSQL